MGKFTAQRGRFFRIKPDDKVTLVFPYGKYENRQIRNLSLTEMFVEGVFPVKQKEYCFVYLSTHEKRVALCFQATARVVRRNVFGIGLEFTSMSVESYNFLQKLLYGAKKPLNILQELPNNCPFEITDHQFASKKSKSVSFVLLNRIH